MVDATIVGQGRDAELVREVAAASDVTVVTATGLFIHDELPAYFRFRRPRPDAAEDALTEMFIRDVTEGIGTTGVRAGVLKCATERCQPTADALRVIRATA